MPVITSTQDSQILFPNRFPSNTTERTHIRNGRVDFNIWLMVRLMVSNDVLLVVILNTNRIESRIILLECSLYPSQLKVTCPMQDIRNRAPTKLAIM